jgi:hypothetical protein
MSRRCFLFVVLQVLHTVTHVAEGKYASNSPHDVAFNFAPPPSFRSPHLESRRALFSTSCIAPKAGRREVRIGLSKTVAVASDRAAQPDSDTIKHKSQSLPFTLRRARPHELDLLAILSTEAFTPRGEWFDVVQRLRFQAVCLDLQNQFYQRFYHVMSPKPLQGNGEVASTSRECEM